MSHRKVEMDIINYLKANPGAFIFDLYDNLNYTQAEIVSTLLKLESEGKVMRYIRNNKEVWRCKIFKQLNFKI